MATNKNATIRYQALNRCFRNPGRQYYIDDLIEACNESLMDLDPSSSGVKRRQIFDDIKFMRDSRGFNAPIESFKDGKKAFYRYEDLSFSINNQPLNEQEAQQLKESLLTLSRFKGMPQLEWIEEMITRLESSFNLKSNMSQVIEFEQNPYLKGLDFFSLLYQAIADQKTLEITYKSFKETESKTFIVHPYYLKQYNNRWFLFGQHHSLNKLSNLALDRIEKIEGSNIVFLPTDIDFQEYFEDIVGVTIPENGEVQSVIIEIKNSRFPYVYSKPIHGSQKILERREEVTIIQLKLILNYEVESLLFSFGGDIRIIEPEKLIKSIISKAEQTFLQYKT